MNSIPILYENDEILVINKPSGLAVQLGEGLSHSLDKDFSQSLGYKIYLVHRLDKDTSGLMIVAKSPFAASKWTKIIGSKGQWVSQGTRIGLVGSTGYSTGPHLHFTVYKNGKMMDPMTVLNK